ncbi:hypothetical protein [Clostridium estertheticum]|uniref:hypothetical protein n=1 Tax=Clostridium estertheticum TaxID=238834 RepID=UPI001C0B960F|nr:hypothetical protein [Clostridium estertheticum]MBU3186630.1 hypothetical protein [Clostridium estertheticum]
MDAAIALENVFHETMLRECKTEEASQWENARHEIMSESIIESCNYYGQRNCKKEYKENERE